MLLVRSRILPLGTWCINRCSAGSGAGCFELLVEDVRSLLRERGGRKSQPTAVVIDSRTLSIDAGIESAGGL
jgi:hypothetical protein